MQIYRYMAGRLIFPLFERVRRTHVLAYLRQLEQMQWWPREQIESQQNEKLACLIAHSYKNVPYWRRLLDDLKLAQTDIRTKADLFKLPILTKKDIRSNLDNMLAVNYPCGSLIEQHSSGSTGEPLKYYDDKDHYSLRLASMLRFWHWADYDFGMRWARISLWPHNGIIPRISDRLARCLYICIDYLDDSKITEDLEKVRNFRPEIIRGYACATYLLAKKAKELGIKDIRPKAIITTGDTLFSHYRRTIEEQFGCKVYDTYGGEGMVISGQCEKGSYHIADDCVIVEFLRDDGGLARLGELANIIMTDLRNYAMPFIRYKIEDVGRASDKACSCGRGLSAMESIEGRASDIIRTPAGNYLIVHFFTALFEYIEGVEQFQIIQRKPDEIEVRIVKNDRFTDKDIEYIDRSIKQGGGEHLKVKFTFVNDIPVEKSGKRRFIISETGPAAGQSG